MISTISVSSNASVTSSHYDIQLWSFDWLLHWFEITYYQYMWITIGAIFVMGLMFAILVMAISNIIPNMIAGIVLYIVVLFIAIYSLAVYVINHLFELDFPKHLLSFSIATLSVIAMIAMIVTWRSEMKKDIV